MNEFTELNEADLGTVVGGTDLQPCSGYMDEQFDAILPTFN